LIHFCTVHFHSERWIDPQLRAIEKHTTADYRIWACLNGIDPSYSDRFHRTFDLEGEHGDKLNELAREVTIQAASDDLIVFIDGDAFPIDDWVAPVTEKLGHYPIVAVRRSENLGDPQPHPCFAVTTVGWWNEIGGDWSRGGKAWTNEIGIVRRDAGGRVLAYLDEHNIEWYPLVRTNRREMHPVLFAIYADLVYHHGSAFRETRTMVDRHLAGCYRHKRGPLAALANRRLAQREKENLAASEKVFAAIERDPDAVRGLFL
jgi:hypothetical protein